MRRVACSTRSATVVAVSALIVDGLIDGAALDVAIVCDRRRVLPARTARARGDAGRHHRHRARTRSTPCSTRRSPCDRRAPQRRADQPTTHLRRAFVEQPWSLMVRVLGQVDVVDRDGTAVAFERGKALELVVWLSQHRERPTRQAAQDGAVGPGRARCDVRQRRQRRTTGDGTRRAATGRRGVDRAHAHRAAAAALASCRTPTCCALVSMRRVGSVPRMSSQCCGPGSSSISDMPFAGTGYLWPDAEGITSSLTLLATGAATELARACLALGDVDGVFWATGQGLKVLYGHEELIALRMRAHAQLRRPRRRAQRVGGLRASAHRRPVEQRRALTEARRDPPRAPRRRAETARSAGQPAASSSGGMQVTLMTRCSSRLNVVSAGRRSAR